MNPLGAKGIGESATIGATPAVQNAVVDALKHLGVKHIDLPCTAAARLGARSSTRAPTSGASRRPPSTELSTDGEEPDIVEA